MGRSKRLINETLICCRHRVRQDTRAAIVVLNSAMAVENPNGHLVGNAPALPLADLGHCQARTNTTFAAARSAMKCSPDK